MIDDESNNSDSERMDEQVHDLHDLVVRGKDYRETRAFDYLGTQTEVVMKPMIDEAAIPLTASLHGKFDMDVEEARDEVEEARDEDGEIDVGNLDEEFVGLMQRAAKHSIDREDNGWSEEQFKEILGGTINGLIVELGMEGFELAGTAEDAELFRGRGSR